MVFLYVLVLFFAINPYVSYGFVPGPQFYTNVHNQPSNGKSINADIDKLEKQQGFINDTVATLTDLVNKALIKIKNAESHTSSEIGIVNRSTVNLTNLVNKALTKVVEVESSSSKQVSVLKSQIESVTADMKTLKTLVANISTVRTVKTSTTVKGKQETKEEEKEGSCPTSKGYHLLSSKLCIRQSDVNDSLNWYDSRDACKRDGGNLVTFYSRKEQEQVMQYFEAMGKAALDKEFPIMRSWVGMSKSKGKFQFLSDSIYSGKWGKDQPKNYSIFKCVALVYDGLNDAICGARRRYICQIRMATTGYDDP